ILRQSSSRTFGSARQDLGLLTSNNGQISGGIGKALGLAFDEFLIKGKAASDVVQSLEKDLLALGRRSLMDSSGSGIDGIFPSLFSGAGNALTRLIPGFAKGGQFTVGGAAGRDRNLVGLRLTRGERVRVETPAQQRQAVETGMFAPAQNVSLSFQITTPDADSFRRSQSQIQSEALRSARRLVKRNG
ncbi:MAG: hypothetical protein ABJN51_20445, partial [Sneathiella sp.]